MFTYRQFHWALRKTLPLGGSLITPNKICCFTGKKTKTQVVFKKALQRRNCIVGWEKQADFHGEPEGGRSEQEGQRYGISFHF